MQICKRYITVFENCTFRNAEGSVQAVRVFHISEGTIFNYCKIQVSNRPTNTLRKHYWVVTVGKTIVCSYALEGLHPL
jgi:hypothetical protein